MTNNNNNKEDIISEVEAQQQKQKQKQIIDQLHLLKRLLESQEKGEKITQSKIATAGNMSVVTLRKRFLDVKQIFPHLPDNALSKNE